MLAKERQDEIFSIIKQKKAIKMSDVVKKYQVSHETARRDLEVLQEQGLIKRVYGGAILSEQVSSLAGMAEQPCIMDASSSVEREAIGREAAKLVKEGDTVLLSVGSTVLQIAKHIRDIKHITVLTNSIFVLNELIDSDVRMFVLGGCVNSSEYDMEGHLTVEALKHFCVDIAFICAGGITKENGVSDYNCEVAQVNKAILSRARKTVLVAHAKKFGADSFSVTCPLDSIHTIISDSTLSQGYVRYLQEKGIELILADVGQIWMPVRDLCGFAWDS